MKELKQKIVVLTGTPGTGKSSIAKELSLSQHWKLLKINEIVEKHKLSLGYDSERHCQIVDPKQLADIVKRLYLDGAGTGLAIEGHLAHFLPSSIVDLCVVTTTGISELNKRLKRRGYPKLKIQENLQAEIFQVCMEEAKKLGHNIYALDTTRLTPKESCKKIEGQLRNIKINNS